MFRAIEITLKIITSKQQKQKEFWKRQTRFNTALKFPKKQKTKKRRIPFKFFFKNKKTGFKKKTAEKDISFSRGSGGVLKKNSCDIFLAASTQK